MRSPRPAVNTSLSESRVWLRAEEAAAPLPPLLVQAERVATVVAQGVHGRRRTGTGDSFWQYRRYQPGDPAQDIDWRQSARAQSAYIRENEWEAAQNVYFWVDRSPSMGWHSHPELPTKAERAAVIALALASLLADGGERIALLETGARPVGGRAALLHLAAVLTGDKNDYGRSGLPRLEALRRHSRLVLVGDFLDAPADIAPVVRAFSTRGYMGHLVAVRDPAEEDLPFRGRTRFEGLEGEGGVLLGRADSVDEEYRLAVRADRDALADICRHNGWSLTLHRTDRSAGPALLALHMLMSEKENR